MWVKVTIEALFYPFKAGLIVLIWLYKKLISPMFPKTCRFYPTCSEYMLIAINEWGLFKGLVLGIKRICRCRPNGKCGEDFVPLNIKGDLKWIF
ncbi:MAG: membrane protein insertion efficiency factor YidD [Christensenellales bacterium]